MEVDKSHRNQVTKRKIQKKKPNEKEKMSLKSTKSGKKSEKSSKYG